MKILLSKRNQRIRVAQIRATQVRIEPRAEPRATLFGVKITRKKTSQSCRTGLQSCRSGLQSSNKSSQSSNLGVQTSKKGSQTSKKGSQSSNSAFCSVLKRLKTFLPLYAGVLFKDNILKAVSK